MPKFIETGVVFDVTEFMRGLLMIGRQLQPPDRLKELIPKV